MDKKYIQEFTHSWHVEGQSKNIKLYTYFDTVEYDAMWAILDNDDNYIYHWNDNAHGNNYDFFTAVVEIFTNINENNSKKILALFKRLW